MLQADLPTGHDEGCGQSRGEPLGEDGERAVADVRAGRDDERVAEPGHEVAEAGGVAQAPRGGEQQGRSQQLERGGVGKVGAR